MKLGDRVRDLRNKNRVGHISGFTRDGKIIVTWTEWDNTDEMVHPQDIENDGPNIFSLWNRN